MNKGFKIVVAFIALMIIIAACSTEKNTFINRNYHSLTAHYNGYYNANELLDESMSTYRNSRTEDFYQVIPVNPMPSEEEVIGMYPMIDTAISKCKKVIRNHSMPSNDRPARKREEHNRWIDENWTTIGIASYYRRDYPGAIKSFEFVSKFYDNDPSLYVGELWTAKTHIATGNLTEAKFHLDNLDKAITEEEDRKGEKKSKKGKKDEIAPFPKAILFDLERTKAELALEKGEKEKAVQFLESALKKARFADRQEKPRVHFVLGQLYEGMGNPVKAEEHYSSVYKKTANYNMAFNARLKKTFLGQGDKVKKELNKMLNDAKNAEFKDQIYYALADIELREGNEKEGVDYLHASAFYSTNNSRQKGMAYERLGDMRFDRRDYVQAQKYYDSCATVIEDNYPNAEGIRNKALKLADLVVAVETAEYEDSVQRIAALPEAERTKFLKDLVKKIKKEEQERKEKEAERLRELQANENLFVQAGSGSKWYWNNAKLRSQGYDEFKRLWGQRENEDDWRRSDKTVIGGGIDGTEEGSDTLDIVQEDSLTHESLALDLPLTDSALAVSNERLLEAYYNAGKIYKDQLNEPKIAEDQFMNVLDRKIENPHNLLSAYELYNMHKEGDLTKASVHKSYILDNYPTSDFANYLRDPDYFVKKKEMDALAEQEYVKVLDRYNRGLYYPVMSKADIVIDEEKDNVYRAKYMLLKALCIGQTTDKKEDMIPTLEMVAAEYEGSDEAVRAQEMLEIIKNGYSKNEAVDFSNKFPFTYDDRAELTVLIFIDEKMSASTAKSRVIDFQREFFSRDRLKVNSKVYGKSSIVLVDQFDTESDASKYISVYKRTRKYLLDMQKAKILMITKENLKVLFQKQNLEVYEKFYEEYY